MRILVFSRLRLDRPTAHAVHNVHTSAALACAGARTVLHADLGGATTEAILKMYGAAPSPNFTIRDMGWRWHAAALPLVAGGLLKAEAGQPAIVLLNEVRPFALTLARTAKSRGHRLLFEAHNAAGLLAFAAAGAPAPGDSATGERVPAAARGSHEAVHVMHDEAHGAHDHGSHAHEDHDDDHGSEGAGPGPVLAIAKTRAAAAAPAAGGSRPKAADPEEDAEEAAGRERARPKIDPVAAAAAERKAALEREILSLADILIAPQRLTLDAVKSMLRPGVPAHVVPNGTPLPDLLPAREKDIDVLYLGSLQPWKGVDALVAAMQRLYPYTMTIVGGREDADRRLLQQMALQIGVAARVKFIPAVPPSEVFGIYARAKVGVAPLSGAFLEAREFTFPMKLIEMMAAGLPIVTAKLPSVEQIVADGREVLMAASDNPDAYGAAIRRLLEDPELAARLGAAARAKAEEFSYDRRAARILEAIKDLPA